LSGVLASVACIQRLVRNATETLMAEGLALQTWRLCCYGHLQGKTMILDLAGKHAIVTGSTSGIGFAIARGLAEAGATMVLNGRTEKSVDAAINRLTQRVPQVKVEGVAADLAAAAGVAAFTKRVGETDILVNNLGIFEPNPTS
jgi:hypothetical protein